ncbi:dihydroflavonol-4-reductase [Acetobacter senegalensis]|uniref:Dihydroflavonol-4-reductase n=1 Tax=Acetobacter senegalensis TaxID=446692 RepID=A0A0U5FPQ1_9PROT|nr:SDR family oxidoreductase [Acetobacter senegalensis]CEF41773.1 dihydroflavonol-4-reductase [Acetobacter senegalensis]
MNKISLVETPLAFVTGATGLLGNNLVRALLTEGFRVRALVRSSEKAKRQFDDLSIEIVTGDILDIDGFAPALEGVDVIFHTAAYFRDSYVGGNHWPKLHAANVLGTRALLERAHAAGVRRFVRASSIAVLRGKRGEVVDETMLRNERDADDYYRSKILSDREVLSFLDRHRDFWATMVLPGWMHGPGDMGPTSAGQIILDVARGKVPGVPPGSASLVDARDVAEAMILANRQGRRGERYLAAGRHFSMADLMPLIGRALGVQVPTRRLPLALLYVIAAVSEAQARLAGKPVLFSWAMARAILTENERSRFSTAKSKTELGLTFRPVEDTLRDEITWFRSQGWLPDKAL